MVGCMSDPKRTEDPYTVDLDARLCGMIAHRKSLGLIVRDYNSSVSTVKYRNVKSGVVVTNIVVGSPSDREDIRIGDAVTRINGEKIYSAEHFSKLLRNSIDELTLTIVNSDGEQTISVKKQVVSMYMDGCSYRYRIPKG